MARTAGHRRSGLRRDAAAAVVRMGRGGPAASSARHTHSDGALGPEAAAAAWDVVIDSCRVRAKRGGELTGPNPTDRAKRGTKYHVVVASDGIPLAAFSAANVHDTML